MKKKPQSQILAHCININCINILHSNKTNSKMSTGFSVVLHIENIYTYIYFGHFRKHHLLTFHRISFWQDFNLCFFFSTVLASFIRFSLPVSIPFLFHFIGSYWKLSEIFKFVRMQHIVYIYQVHLFCYPIW